jgi:ATP synthase protein I
MLANRELSNRVVLAQSAVTLGVSFLLLLLDWVHAYSGLIGGGIATLGNALFAHRVFVRYQAQEPGRLLARFYGAEIQKLILTGLLFAAAVVWIKPLSLGALFGMFLFVQMVPILYSTFFID